MSLLVDRPSTPAQEPLHDRPGFFSFFGYFSFQKEKKKSNKEFWDKRKIEIKKIGFLNYLRTRWVITIIEKKKPF